MFCPLDGKQMSITEEYDFEEYLWQCPNNHTWHGYEDAEGIWDLRGDLGPGDKEEQEDSEKL